MLEDQTTDGHASELAAVDCSAANIFTLPPLGLAGATERATALQALTFDAMAAWHHPPGRADGSVSDLTADFNHKDAAIRPIHTDTFIGYSTLMEIKKASLY